MATSRSPLSGFRKNKWQTQLQACAGIGTISAGSAHEKMSPGDFSASECSWTLRGLRAVNPGNGNVCTAPLRTALAKVPRAQHLGPPVPGPSAGLTKELRRFKSAQGKPFPELPEAGPSVP